MIVIVYHTSAMMLFWDLQEEQGRFYDLKGWLMDIAKLYTVWVDAR